MRKIHRNPNVMWREEVDALAEVREALDRGDDVEDEGTSVLFSGGTMLSLNYLGTEIWKLCDGRSVEGGVAELLPRFDVEEEVLRADVAAFLDELAARGFVTYNE
ncbi:GeoRSP system PqqD family peptide chaperone [Geobacter sp.]|uniref:GeoRSP system PqqD family peptide chaperone n=1 Tax=Geobacter sp. TaxID=46610 RepID=UPI0026177F5A|nr:GeoRSP system PqqD family peptide chaperone [Geobacter sp.]